MQLSLKQDLRPGTLKVATYMDKPLEVNSELTKATRPSGDFEKHADTHRDQSMTAADQRLVDLGYKPEFRREMSLFGVLGISFCTIGILTGMSSAFQTGLFSGGPLGLFWGWNVDRLSKS